MACSSMGAARPLNLGEDEGGWVVVGAKQLGDTNTAERFDFFSHDTVCEISRLTLLD